MVAAEGLFADTVVFPDEIYRERFNALIGLDAIKTQLLAQAEVLLDPSKIDAWSARFHGTGLPAVRDVLDRTALVVLAGDVGTGKTELAETVGDTLARNLRVDINLYSLSLSARGHGAVGEMTTLLTQAFETVSENAKAGRGRSGQLRHGTILLIDEADAIAQSRELAQMHHEDRAGVNALIRGIDGLRRARLPVLTIMCTNRVDALDPAVRRRAAIVLRFERPDDADRAALLEAALAGVKLKSSELDEIVSLTGSLPGRDFGATYSDLRQRFIPEVVLDAYARSSAITGARVVELAKHFEPTRPFGTD